MAKVRGVNQKSKYNALNKRLAKYIPLVQSIYDRFNKEMARLAIKTGYKGDVPFKWSDYPELREQVLDVQRGFAYEMKSLIYSGTSNEWKQSNLVQDLLADKVLKSYGLKRGGKKTKIYYQTNSDALRAFQKRKDGGLTVSQKIWNQSLNYKTEMEYAISSAIEKGTSAVTLSKRLSKYLNDFPKLQKDYKQKYGKAVDCKNCEYRSIRLARSEINMAYRTAEQERWLQFDFVLGYEIKTSTAHPKTDVCDRLQGKYPKTFKWTGWHPNCTCYAVPILKSEDEFFDEKDAEYITDIPKGMKDFLVEQEEKVNASEKKGTLPYWISNNRQELKEEVKSYKEYSNSPEYTEFKYNKDYREQLMAVGYKNPPLSSDYNESPMAGFNVLELDKKVEDICDKYGVMINEKDLTVEFDYALLKIKGYLNNERTKENEFTILREFKFTDDDVTGGTKKSVFHHIFKMPESMQGKGISKSLFAEMFVNYEKMGVENVFVHANIDVGGLCWGKYGFKGERKSVISALESQLINNKITKEDYNFAISYVNQFEGDIPMQGLAYSKIGEKLLLGTDWDGYIDMKDLEQTKYLKKYLRIQ